MYATSLAQRTYIATHGAPKRRLKQGQFKFAPLKRAPKPYKILILES